MQKDLTRASVVEAALDLLDEVGLDALSMRRLAAKLGVQNPALYWHFRNKQELLNEMSRAMLEPSLGPPRAGETWQEWLNRRAHLYRSILLGRRDGARVIVGGNPGPSVGRKFEQELRIMIAFGFGPAASMLAIGAISHYTTGFVLDEQSREHDPSPERIAALAEEYPTVVAAVREGGTPTSDDAYAYGLRLLIDGMAERQDGSRG
ncbi:TetR/AcrR family transcriptional regulator C-terminal domain-containing protein [Tenggerimyces flavus]|uniref:TetR/AcrR family transcriptional regulator C-terminal domain-containing protein n=1 Tax=Tenggerimyces flavus TaxID=1708749 RepID=A0ABV7YFI7_9ACTN|nr:TetR/AcrR family transcriptional regulator C-terminal domain-containing protein [Tenggerimyces flavus]MBM7783890.1 TetR/AcrR family tetracycline transcriptional repressor [Tenggerimyces flavus]